jgi:hypothetical protein
MLSASVDIMQYWRLSRSVVKIGAVDTVEPVERRDLRLAGFSASPKFLEKKDRDTGKIAPAVGVIV